MSVIAVGKYDIPTRGLVLFTIIGAVAGAGALVAFPPPRPAEQTRQVASTTDPDKKGGDTKKGETKGDKGKGETKAPPKASGNETYADARLAHSSSLTAQGPSPTRAGPLKSLPGAVVETTYPSGDLTLKAYWGAKQKFKTAKKPGVVLLHEGFALTEDFVKASSNLRAEGFVVFMPTLRGENGNPGAFSLLHDEVNDVLAAADAFGEIAEANVDPEQLYLAGYKEGGTLAVLAALADTRGRFKGLAVFGGPLDPRPGLVRENPKAVPFKPDDDAEWRVRTPLAFLNELKLPARFYQPGDLDAEVGKARSAAPAGVEFRSVAGYPNSLGGAMQGAATFFKSLKAK